MDHDASECLLTLMLLSWENKKGRLRLGWLCVLAGGRPCEDWKTPSYSPVWHKIWLGILCP